MSEPGVAASRQKVQPRARGYAAWAPRGRNAEVLEQVVELLEALQDYWPITPRQVVYRLMAAGLAIKADAERVGNVLVRGRRAGLIDWEAIGDSRTESRVPSFYDGPADFRAAMREWAGRYRLDRQGGQEEYLEVVVEAAGAVDQIWRTTSPYSVPVYSGSGFSTVASLREAVLRAEDRGVPTTILVLGDLDPSGIDIRSRVREDIEGFALEHYCDIDVQELALTEEQVEDLELIRGPIAATKAERFPWWPRNWTVELEALAPEELAGIVLAALEARTNAAVRQELLEHERAERAQLIRELGGER